MRTNTWPPKCEECGKFIGQRDKNAIAYTPYGSCNSLDPPEEVYICGKCFLKLDEQQLKRLYDTTWLKPSRIAGEIGYDA